MPPKEINPTAGTLYLNGERLCDVSEPIEVIPDAECGEPRILGVDISHEGSFTCSYTITKSDFKVWLYFTVGHSNNWLKMHGYGVIRKRRNRKK